MKKVILTGADGFVGRQAIQPLLERHFEVHAVSNLSPPDELRFENVHWHKTNLLDDTDVKNLTERVDATHLLHFAWYVEHGKFWTSEQNKAWVEAGSNLFGNFLASGGERIVASGTCVEYELDTDELLNEFSTPLMPQALYGQCKLELQKNLAERSTNYAWGRIFFLFGEYEHPNRLVSSVINSLLAGNFADCSHGRQIRDFLHVADVAEAFVALLDSNVKGGINIASGEAKTIRELVEEVASILGKPEKVRFDVVPSPDVEPKRIVADVMRLREEVKWKPSNSLRERLEQTIGWWRENRASRNL